MTLNIEKSPNITGLYNVYGGNKVFIGEMICLEDGFYYFQPSILTGGGCWTEHSLREIADWLQEKNAE